MTRPLVTDVRAAVAAHGLDSQLSWRWKPRSLPSVSMPVSTTGA
jgi:hypothetical protein